MADATIGAGCRYAAPLVCRAQRGNPTIDTVVAVQHLYISLMYRNVAASRSPAEWR